MKLERQGVFATASREESAAQVLGALEQTPD